MHNIRTEAPSGVFIFIFFVIFHRFLRNRRRPDKAVSQSMKDPRPWPATHRLASIVWGASYLPFSLQSVKYHCVYVTPLGA